jgi:hypothetical protein
MSGRYQPTPVRCGTLHGGAREMGSRNARALPPSTARPPRFRVSRLDGDHLPTGNHLDPAPRMCQTSPCGIPPKMGPRPRAYPWDLPHSAHSPTPVGPGGTLCGGSGHLPHRVPPHLLSLSLSPPFCPSAHPPSGSQFNNPVCGYESWVLSLHVVLILLSVYTPFISANFLRSKNSKVATLGSNAGE